MLRLVKTGDPPTLAAKLEAVSEASIDWIAAVLALPLDADNGHLLRAQVAAAATALNAQLRADHMRLRAMREDKAMTALLALIAAKERIVPPCPGSGAVRAQSAEPGIAGNGPCEGGPAASNTAANPPEF